MHNIKRLSLLPAALMAVLLLPAGAAIAHEGWHGGDRHYEVPAWHRYERAAMPRWLRKDRDFRRWYRLNRYYFGPRVSWRRLYRAFERDYWFHRHYGRHNGRDYGKKYRKRKHRNRYYDD